MSPNPCPHKPKPAQKSNQESLKTKTPPITPPNRQVGSQSFKRLGVIAVAMVGLCLLFYYLVGLYFWLTEKLPINFQPAFYFLGIVLPTSGFVHVGSKFANRTHPE